MKNGNDKLDELLRQFMDDSHVHDFKEDLDFADCVFAAYPVPAVRQETLAAIKAKIRRKLMRHRLLTAGKWMAAAAAVLFIAVLTGDRLVAPAKRIPSIAATFYSNEDIWRDDFFAMNSQVDSIEQELTELAGAIHAAPVKAFGATDTFSIDMKELDEIEHFTKNTSLGKGGFYAH